jgi:hypothetical protein
VGFWSWIAEALDRNRREAALERRIRALTDEERRAILSASDYEFLWEQEDDGVIVRKDEPDLQRAVSLGLGWTHITIADDVIIRHYLRSHEGP